MFVSHIFLNVFDFHSEFESKGLDLLVLIPEGGAVVSKIVRPLFMLSGGDFDKILQALYILFQILINPAEFLFYEGLPQNSGIIDSFL